MAKKQAAKQELPEVPEGFVRVKREPTKSGRDYRHVSQEAYDANPKAYKLYK